MVIVFAESYGDISWNRQAFPTNQLTLFDLSSVTSVFTASAFRRLVDEGMVHGDDPVCAILHDRVGFRPILPDDSQQTPVISAEKREQKKKSVDASKIPSASCSVIVPVYRRTRCFFCRKAPKLQRFCPEQLISV